MNLKISYKLREPISRKTNIQKGLLKGGALTVCRFKGGLGRKKGWYF